MSEVGTLKELNVQPGDVVAFEKAEDGFDRYNDEFRGVDDLVATQCGGVRSLKVNNGFSSECTHKFRLISRAAVTPKLWRDMTPEEKGALLLAMYEKKEVQEYHFCAKVWVDHFWNAPIYTERAYRVKPDPKVETVTLYGRPDVQWVLARCEFDTHKITFTTTDGKPDCASIKMEPLA